MVSAQAALFCGHVSLDSGLLEQAQTNFEAALRHSLALKNRTMSSAAIEWMIVVGGHEHHDVALIDAFTQLRRNSPGTASPRPEQDLAVAEAREALTDGDYAAYAARGRTMGLDNAIDYARAAARRRLHQLN
jgi:3-dehydroquinate dehydratase